MEDIQKTEISVDIFEAAYKKRLRLTRLLLEGGTGINSIDENGRNVLLIALLSRYEDTQSTDKETFVRFLLERGANPNYKDNLGKTALIHLCQEKGVSHLIQLLLEFDADPTLVDIQGIGPLPYAADSGDESMISILASACKAKGKDVIIVRPKVKQLCTSTDNKDKAEESGSGLLFVPLTRNNTNKCENEDKTTTTRDGKPRVIGSPKPRPKLRHLNHTEEKLSLEVPSPTDLDRCSFLHAMRADSSSDDNLSLVQSPDAESSSKQGGRVRVLRRRNTADLFPANKHKTFTPPIRRRCENRLQKQSLYPLNEYSLDEVKVSLLEWEKELTKSVTGACEAHSINKEKDKKVLPPPTTVFRHPELDINFLEPGDPFISNSVRKTSSLKGLERVAKEFSPSMGTTSYGRRRIIGPGGRILERQGSGAKLFDTLSSMRPGTLPPLNVNVNPPIPGISGRIGSADDIRNRDNFARTPNNSMSSTPDSEAAHSPLSYRHSEYDPDSKARQAFFSKYVTEDKRVISHPHRQFLTQKSATLEMGDIIKILSANDKPPKCLPHIGEFGYGS